MEPGRRYRVKATRRPIQNLISDTSRSPDRRDSTMPATLLAYTITSSLVNDRYPSLSVGSGGGNDETYFRPAHPQNNSYWIVIIDATNPRVKVKEWIVPGENNAVPGGIDTYMNDPDYIFAVATQTLSTLHVPQGAFFDFLVKYGAGRELQRLEQLNSALGYGLYGQVSYILTSQCGPRGGPLPSPPSYEVGAYTNPALLMMSLESLPDGAPPYSIADINTFIPRRPHP